MPYQELINAAASDPSLHLEACTAFAPDDQFDAYSYASEHLDDDQAIASLVACAVALRSSAASADFEVAGPLNWIDRELARLWTARGVHPGLGSALSGFGLEHGVLLAHEIVRAAAKDDLVFNAFAFVDAFAADPKLFPEAEALNSAGASGRNGGHYRRAPRSPRACCALQPEPASPVGRRRVE